jgi:DNA repair exonuclease SbcCD ATPase subunit
MSAVMDENAGTVALLEATTEARTLIEDVNRLAEELKVRQERLGELLAPSEAALRARTEYLDKVMREQLGRAEQRVSKLGEEVERIARSLNDHVVQMPARLAEADARRWNETRRRERWRTVVSLLAMLLGGFLAGQVASYRSGGTANAKPPTVEERTSARKSARSAQRRAAGPSSKPNVAPAR